MKKTLLIVLAVLIIAGVAWWIWSQKDKPVREGWLPYENNEVGFMVQYWPEMRIVPQQQPPKVLSFVYIGPTQSLGTELYDGINATFHRDELGDRNISKYIEGSIGQIKVVGEITTPLETVTVNGMNGFAYSASSLGQYRMIFLEAGDDEVMVISILVPDPANRGYQSIVDDMLSTLKLKD